MPQIYRLVHTCVTTQSQVDPVHMNTPPGICVARGGAQGKGGSCRCLCHLIVMAESLAAAGSAVLWGLAKLFTVSHDQRWGIMERDWQNVVSREKSFVCAIVCYCMYLCVCIWSGNANASIWMKIWHKAHWPKQDATRQYFVLVHCDVCVCKKLYLKN